MFIEDEYDMDETQQGYPYRPWLAHFSKGVCALTLCLLFAGALVTSNDAGLAVPDWPTSYGYSMFLFPISQWQGGIVFEHVHRLIASVIGALTVVLTLWIALVEERSWVRKLCFCALAAVVCQGVLGGITVLYLLPDAISTFHGILGQTFFIMTIVLAYSQSWESKNLRWIRPVKHLSRLFSLSLVSCVLVFLQLVIGAWMRHSGAGLAVLDFPLMGGRLFPSWSKEFLLSVNEMRATIALPAVGWGQVIVHLAHRLSGVIVASAVIVVSVLLYRNAAAVPRLRRLSIALGLLVSAQFLLGVLTVLSVRQPLVTSLHVWVGALLLGLSALLVARLQRMRFLRRRGNLCARRQ